KDVIILLDKSGSMEGERKLGAVNATKNIISSLGGRDRFNILTFSDEIASFSDALSLVGEDNQLAAFDFLDRMVTGGTTNYDLAFTEGLDRLNRFGSDRRTPVVVFITDGAPTIGTRDNNTLIEKIQQANGPVGAQFVLFGISSETDHQLLSEIANEMGGANIRINTTEQIEGAISNYQDFLSLNKQAVISWSLPYLDTNGQGLVITTSIPLIVNSQLRGVISVDIRLETLVEFIVQDQLSENSYSYVFDIAGNSIVHPDVDLNTSTAETIRQPITQLEVDTEEFGELLSLAQKDQAVTQLLDYNGQDTLVSFTPIGNTSMILGMTTPLTDLIPDEVEAKINSLAINTLAFVPGVALGLLGALIMIVLRGRLLREDAPQIVAESPQNSKEEEA
ncbi:MAG: VWA domain-containing protein, partial [Candidatus Kariarchaeaceae archaeon]